MRRHQLISFLLFGIVLLVGLVCAHEEAGNEKVALSEAESGDCLGTLKDNDDGPTSEAIIAPTPSENESTEAVHNGPDISKDNSSQTGNCKKKGVEEMNSVYFSMTQDRSVDLVILTSRKSALNAKLVSLLEKRGYSYKQVVVDKDLWDHARKVTLRWNLSSPAFYLKGGFWTDDVQHVIEFLEREDAPHDKLINVLKE